MQLHGAVEINSDKGATTENQGVGAKYTGQEVYVDDFVCVICHDMTTPLWWREKVIVYYCYVTVQYLCKALLVTSCKAVVCVLLLYC